MIKLNTDGRAALRTLAIAAVATGAFVMVSTSTRAGTCPVDKVGVDVTKPGATASKDVTDMELAAIDLAEEMVGLNGHRLRMRELHINPGGEVAWHSHADRPALILIVEGEMTEYSSSCAVPIEHTAGEVSREAGGVAHWWRNNGTTTARLISADIVNDK